MSLIGLMGSIAGFVRVRFLHDRADIDNAVFRLHYSLTSAFFFAACVIITAFDLIGSPIDCITDDSISRPEVINTYCWIQHTFTLPGPSASTRDLAMPYPGVRPEDVGAAAGERRIHSYYQWVPFVLFFQGILFYLPHWLWKQWEEGRIRHMTDGIRGFHFGFDSLPEERRARSASLANYIQETLDTHGRLAWAYTICEWLNLVNCLANIFFIDKFLGGTFLDYGLRVIQFSDQDQEDRRDIMIEVFPRMTKCTFHKYGSSGTIQKHDALCVLAWNIFNEKVYIFLWFWLIILTVLSALAVLYRFFIIASTSVRLMVIQRVAAPNRTSAEAVIRRIPFGDYFLIHLLAKNLDGFLLSDVIDDLAQRFTNAKSPSSTSSLAATGPGVVVMETAPILTKYPGVQR